MNQSKSKVLSAVRHSISFLGGLLVLKGYFDDAVLQEIIGSVMGLVSVIWGIVDKNEKV